MTHYLDADGDGRPDLAPLIVGSRTDARNRSVRTLLQGLAFDVGLAALLYLLPIFGTTATDWSTLDWKLVALSLVKTVVAAGLSYAMRLFKVSRNTITV